MMAGTIRSGSGVPIDVSGEDDSETRILCNERNERKDAVTGL